MIMPLWIGWIGLTDEGALMIPKAGAHPHPRKTIQFFKFLSSPE
jgi:hypothetical protein